MRLVPLFSLSSSVALRALLVMSCALAGCSDKTTPAWALQHGTVDVDADAGDISGYQVWEFFSEKWEKEGDERFHLCTRVQTITGFEESAMPGACDDCVASYSVAVEDLESDCLGDLSTDQDYLGLSRLAVGAVPAALADSDPYPQESLAWYAGWEEGSVALMGFAYDEALTLDEPTTDEQWASGPRYVLEPAWVWSLQ